MGGCSDVFFEVFWSLFGFLSNRFLDLGSAFWGILSSPLTVIEKTPWDELCEAQFQRERRVHTGEGGEMTGLRLRRVVRPWVLGVGQTEGWGRVNLLVR